MKKIFTVLAVLLLSLAAFLVRPAEAFANAPLPARFFIISMENAPENAYGVDFLLQKEKIPQEKYTECNTKALEAAGLPAGCELAVYENDSWVSFLTHHSEAEFEGDLAPVPGKPETLVSYTANYGYKELAESGNVRLAVFDKEGNILSVSDPFDVKVSTPHHNYSNLQYDAASGQAYCVTLMEELQNHGQKPDHHAPTGNFFLILASIALLAAAALVTMLIEFLIALIFRLKPAGWTLLVNFFSNIIFNLLVIIFCIGKTEPLPYGIFVPAGEVLVVIAEYLVYTQIYKELTHRRLLIYSIVANLFSAALVMLATAILVS